MKKIKIFRYICLCLAFVLSFIFVTTSNVAYAAETDETWNSYTVNEVVVKSNVFTVDKTVYTVSAEYSNDGYFRFDYFSLMSILNLNSFDYKLENFDWIFWEDMHDKIVYDNYADGGDSYPDSNGYIVIPIDASYTKYRSTLVLELAENSFNTTLTVKNNIDSQTTTIPAKYMVSNGQYITYISDDYFSSLRDDINSFYNIFKIPGYMFSGKSDFVYQDGLAIDYYVKKGNSVADSITLIYEPFYFVISNNITDEVVKVQPTLITNDDGSYQYEYSFDLGCSVVLDDDQFDLFKDGVLNNCIIQDYFLLRTEYETLTSSFNQLFNISSDYIIDGFFGSETGIRIDYNDRIFKKYDNRLDSLTFVLPSDALFSNKIVLNFSDKDFVERELTEAERWNNFWDNFNSFGEDFLNIIRIVLFLVLLGIVLPFISPILSILMLIVKAIIKVVSWFISLPFKLIKTLFK